MFVVVLLALFTEVLALRNPFVGRCILSRPFSLSGVERDSLGYEIKPKVKYLIFQFIY